jgi:RNA polymerase sigma factor (TIGR02999 family)
VFFLHTIYSTKRQVTQLLEQARTGDQQALNELVPMVYDELRRIASASLRSAGSQQTMLTTDLVHEAFLKLIGSSNVTWENRLHFFNLAATSMRQILVDHARARNARKRGGMFTHVTFNDAIPVLEQVLDDVEILDEVLLQFEKVDSRASRIVELRFFTGLTIEEIAELLNVSSRTVKRDWEFAKAWLYRAMKAT